MKNLRKLSHYFPNFIGFRGFLVTFLAVAVLFFGGCSKSRQDALTTGSPNSTSAEKYQYPHPENWLTQHLSYVSANGEKIVGTQRDCTVCHQNQDLGTADTSIATKSSMVIPQAQPRNVTCAIQCHAPTNQKNPKVSVPSKNTGANVECLNCHKGHNSREKAHYPAAAGLCKTCHQVPAGHLLEPKNNKAATANLEQTCNSCHAKMDQHKFVHKALQVEGSCNGCHDAHGTNQRYLIKAESVQAMCTKCHDVANQKHASVHAVLNSKQSCLTCHNPHGSDHKANLKAAPQQLCLTCHKSIKEKIVGSAYVHGAALAEDGCLSCHNSHAAKNQKLLNAEYPAESYAKYYPGDVFNPSTYELCMKCHNPKMLNKDIAGTETAFRDERIENGKVVRKNLHWFHVVDAAGSAHKTSGRSCFICHDPHGAPQKHNIRSEWPMSENHSVTIEFNGYSNGGNCTKSCHDLRSYKRMTE